MDHHTYLAYRAASQQPVVISAERRGRHVHAIGATGMGKSTLLLSIAAQDIARGDGLMLIDPHGDLAEAVLERIPPQRTKQVCYLSPADLERPVALNVLECHDPDARSLAAESIVAALRAIWRDSWGPRMEDILRYGLLALIEMPGASFALLPRFLTDATYRARVLAQTHDSFTRRYFSREFDTVDERERRVWIAPILNKVGAFIASPAIRNILGQSTSTLDLAHVMAEGQIVIANLSKGRLGETPSSLMGALLVAHLKTAAMARASLPQEARRPFHLIVDEMQLFGTEVFASLLSEARKYNLTLTLANQHSEQLSDELRSSLLANVATIVAFRLGANDAELYAREFQIDPPGLLNMERAEVFVDGTFARVYAPPEPYGHGARIKAQSACRYGRDRAVVEQRLVRALG